jgi:hypothetical protein
MVNTVKFKVHVPAPHWESLHVRDYYSLSRLSYLL